jgi:hypothetical protein
MSRGEQILKATGPEGLIMVRENTGELAAILRKMAIPGMSLRTPWGRINIGPLDEDVLEKYIDGVVVADQRMNACFQAVDGAASINTAAIGKREAWRRG